MRSRDPTIIDDQQQDRSEFGRDLMSIHKEVLTTENPPRACLAIPLLVKGRPIGHLHLDRLNSGGGALDGARIPFTVSRPNA